MRNFLMSMFLGLMFIGHVVAQEHFPVNGVEDHRLKLHVFIHATIYIDYQRKIENATLIIRNGEIENVGENLPIPDGAIVHDITGKFIYPGFIDLYSTYGMSELIVQERRGRRNAAPQYESSRKGAYGWNDAIKSDFNAVEIFSRDEKEAAKLRSQGFGAVLSFRPDGIARGTSVFVALSDLPDQELIIKEAASTHYSFEKGSSTQEYPNSIMGAVALLRQVYYDTDWYKSPLNKIQHNLSLESFLSSQQYPQIFETTSKQRLILADKIGDEFGVQYMFKGSGDEYQLLEDIRNTNGAIIVPVNFPEAYDVEDAYDAINVSLSDMMHWEMAPANPGILASAGIEISLTAFSLDDYTSFRANVRKAIEKGLTTEDAIKALTTTPAKLLGVYDKLGSLDKGKLANFLITSGNPFETEATIFSNWIQGVEFILDDMDKPDYRGMYDFEVNNKTYKLQVSGERNNPDFKIMINDSTSIAVSATIDDNRFALKYKIQAEDSTGDFRLSGWKDEKGLTGDGQAPNGKWLSWSAIYVGESEEKAGPDKKDGSGKEIHESFPEVIYPFTAYGRHEKPSFEKLLFKNATVWTNEVEGILTEADVMIDQGKIIQVGKDINEDGATIVDARGMHLTSGIIDEHSHIALSGVNEGSQSITAEVRMEDALDCESIQIYRQLSGGVTASQLLHGSANPIGGQSVMIKLRWGENNEGLVLKGADPFIKCALGENVKQSNWGSNNTRFPQTRMGVEQVFVDGFTRALAYDQEWTQYNNLPKKQKDVTVKPRRDLELETLAEILKSERFITCHSYVQSEINMLMNVADQFGFTVNTFTHSLEGYKLADKMAKHGAAGSTFADWWAYKYEVWGAIPYNPALMNMAGVNVAVNSDDPEMARRLNQEAAKAVKYGGVSEEDAWKMVTLNPAKMLHLDKRMGSIKVGKDADLVLWTENPLSVYSKVVKTIVDGKIYFDVENDQESRNWMQQERSRLIQEMIDVKSKGGKTKKAGIKHEPIWHCEDVQEVYY